ncbi:MAG TPA: hypothetical protein DCZ91_03015 [Lachnospiraceae bacterium]|nr:hypothetical protein [Lachnospiraceae bacterium]
MFYYLHTFFEFYIRRGMFLIFVRLPDSRKISEYTFVKMGGKKDSNKLLSFLEKVFLSYGV